MAAVANIGTDRNWCGHPFAQANWFAFGRLAWNPDLDAAAIADDWIRMTFGDDDRLVPPVLTMMLASREVVVDYMTPLGLHHLMAWDHHYGPGPWVSRGREDWTSVYFHRADTGGIGFDRRPTGSNAVAYSTRRRCANGGGGSRPAPEPTSCCVVPPRPLGPRHAIRAGRFGDELCHRYSAGVQSVGDMQRTWASTEGLVDTARHDHVRTLLRIQEKEARWWRDSCLLYFQTHSRQPIPAAYERPSATLEELMRIRHTIVPGI